MKKFVTIIAFSLLTITIAVAQDKDIRINLYGAYVFDDQFDTYFTGGSYRGEIKGGFQWGAGIEYIVRPDYGVELLYIRQDTHAPTTLEYSGTTPLDIDLNMNYILLGGLRYAAASSGKVEGFAGLMAGVVIANLSTTSPTTTPREDTATKFSWGLRAGGVFWAADKIGIKLQAQLLSAVQGAGGGFYFGTGGGGAGVSTYSTIYQFSLGGGLVFKVGKGAE